MKSPCRVLLFAPLFPPAWRGGGPIQTIAALVRQAPTGFDTYVLTSDRDLGHGTPLNVVRNRPLPLDGAMVLYASINSVRQYLRMLMRGARFRPDVLYFNSFFNGPMAIFPNILWKAGVFRECTRLWAPRGEFGRAALNVRPFRKRLYIGLFRTCGLDRGVVWHASTAEESRDIRAVWGQDCCILVREDETELPPQAGPVGRDEPSSTSSPARLLFLSRLVEHKGLHIALEALKGVQVDLSFDIYGEFEEAAYRTHCRRLLSELPSNIRVRLHGGIPHSKVQEVMQHHDLLVLPTAGENFGHVVPEALSVSCPVMCSGSTPWSEVLESGGGVVVWERSVYAWREALRSYAESPFVEHENMRERAGIVFGRWRERRSQEHVFSQLVRMI